MSDSFDDQDPGAPAPPQDPGADSSPAGSSPHDTDGDRQGPRQGFVPEYRLQEYAAKNRALTEQNGRIEAEIARMRSGFETALGTSKQDGPQYDPQTQRIREQFLQAFPELKLFVEKQKDFESVLGSMPNVQSHMDATLQQTAVATFKTLDEQLAPQYSDPKTGKVDPIVQRIFQTALIDYLQAAPDAAARYQRGDPSLVAEWFGRVEPALIGRIRRNALAGAQNRGNTVAALPRQTPATSVVPPRGAEAPKSRDEMLEAAFNSMRS